MYPEGFLAKLLVLLLLPTPCTICITLLALGAEAQILLPMLGALLCH